VHALKLFSEIKSQWAPQPLALGPRGPDRFAAGPPGPRGPEPGPRPLRAGPPGGPPGPQRRCLLAALSLWVATITWAGRSLFAPTLRSRTTGARTIPFSDVSCSGTVVIWRLGPQAGLADTKKGRGSEIPNSMTTVGTTGLRHHFRCPRRSPDPCACRKVESLKGEGRHTQR
jgi:hypothetical protein